MYINAIKVVFAALLALAIVAAFGYLSRNAQPITILGCWVAVWWTHNLFDGNGLRPVIRRPVLLRVVTIGIIAALAGACYRSGTMNEVALFSMFALAALLVAAAWLLIAERTTIQNAFRRYHLDW